jgi:hypothetical protein
MGWVMALSLWGAIMFDDRVEGLVIGLVRIAKLNRLGVKRVQAGTKKLALVLFW